MEVVYKTPNGQFEAKFEGKGQDDIFEQVANFQEVFETPNIIKGKNVPLSDIRFIVRLNEAEDKFYEQRYNGADKDLWGFKREFHMRKSPKGAMYVHQYLKSDDDKANYEDGGNGWRKWKGERKGNGNGKPADSAPAAGVTKEGAPF